MSKQTTKDRVYELTNGMSLETSKLLGLVTILEFTIENFDAAVLTMSDLAVLAEQIKFNTDSLVDRAEEVFDMGKEYIEAITPNTKLAQ